MTAPLVVMVEEPSMRIVLEQFCINLGAQDISIVLEHSGKNDLERSIPRKLQAWRSPVEPYFIVLRDLDGGQREPLKARLSGLVPPQVLARTKIRIVIPELEAWYLGDPQALVAAGLISAGAGAGIPRKAAFRNLCNLNGAKVEFKRIVGSMGQIALARQIAPHMQPRINASPNCLAFVSALEWAINAVRNQMALPEEA